MSDSLEDVIKSINKNFKQEIVTDGYSEEKVRRVPFTSPRLNYLTYGGLPIGRLVEFSGDEGSGKSTTALDIVANAQRMFPDRKMLWVDVERTFDSEWAEKLGVDVSSLIYLKPNEQSGEEIMQATKDILSTDEISVCVLDSIGSLVSGQEYDKRIDEAAYTGIAKGLTRFSREIIPICARSDCLFIGINQMRDDLSNPYSSGTTTTGGRAWRHNVSMRLQFRRGDYIDEKGNHLARNCENPCGHIVRVSLLKSKVNKLNRKIGEFTLNYYDGIDAISDIIDIGVLCGAIIQRGSWYYIVDDDGTVQEFGGKEMKFSGRAKLKEGLKAHKAAFDYIAQKSEEKIV